MKHQEHHPPPDRRKARIISLDPTIGFWDAEPMPAGKKSSCHAEWQAFEKMTFDCLATIGYDVSIQPRHPHHPQELSEMAIRVFAHLNRRDCEGELFYKQMHMCNLFTMDTEGWGADHSRSQQAPDSSQIDGQVAAQFCQTLSSSLLVSGSSKAAQPPLDLPLDLPDRYIFVAIQRPLDYVQIHHSKVSVPDFIRILSDWGKRTGNHIVMKLHPYNVHDPGIAEWAAECTQDAPNLSLQEGNIHPLIQRAQGVMVINSGVGFESLIHGKPVVTFGNCDYKWATFQATPQTVDEAFAYISEFGPPQREQVHKFVYHYYRHHCYDVSEGQWMDSKRRLLAMLTQVFPLF